MTKTKWVMTKEELVTFLESVLSQVKEGKLTVDETTVQLPDKAEVEIETEAKKGKKEVELEIKWEVEDKTAEEAESPEKQNGVESQESEAGKEFAEE
ncbi:MAG: amphi-Trp domain-containing protein [Bacillota bacterium]